MADYGLLYSNVTRLGYVFAETSGNSEGSAKHQLLGFCEYNFPEIRTLDSLRGGLLFTLSLL